MNEDEKELDEALKSFKFAAVTSVCNDCGESHWYPDPRGFGLAAREEIRRRWHDGSFFSHENRIPAEEEHKYQNWDNVQAEAEAASALPENRRKTDEWLNEGRALNAEFDGDYSYAFNLKVKAWVARRPRYSPVDLLTVQRDVIPRIFRAWSHSSVRYDNSGGHTHRCIKCLRYVPCQKPDCEHKHLGVYADYRGFIRRCDDCKKESK